VLRPDGDVDGSGNATVAVAAKDAVAIDVNSRVSAGASTVSVTFAAIVTTWWGQNVSVVGSIPGLSGWDPNLSVALSSATYPVWCATVSVPANTRFEYKYIKKDPDGTVEWESDPNRAYTTGTASVSLNDTWR
jgi:alpha-amylase